MLGGDRRGTALKHEDVAQRMTQFNEMSFGEIHLEETDVFR